MAWVAPESLSCVSIQFFSARASLNFELAVKWHLGSQADDISQDFGEFLPGKPESLPKACEPRDDANAGF